MMMQRCLPTKSVKANHVASKARLPRPSASASSGGRNRPTNTSSALRAASAEPTAAPLTWSCSDEFSARANCSSLEQYEAMYKESIESPETFWGKIAEEFHWNKKWDSVKSSDEIDVSKGPVNIKWFEGGETNVCYNAVDRHVENGLGDKTALIFEGNEAGRCASMTYAELQKEVCRLANWLKEQGVKKGDAVAVYMPMVLELPIAMLACARIGAIHTVVFGGFSADALADRIVDSQAKVVLTCGSVMRGKKAIGLKPIVDSGIEKAKEEGAEVKSVLVYDNEAAEPRDAINMVEGRDVWWQDAVGAQSDTCDVTWVGAEDPLFLLYTSGSTGKPKGVLHTTGGYMVYAATTFKYIFDHQEDDVYWCTADCGWITGHTYLAYGPTLNGATQVVFEGVPTFPDAGRCWDMVQRHKVTVFYTAPTLVRSLMAAGDDFVTKYDLSSLRLLGSVGEPINPEAWRWYHEVVGGGRCPIVDTYWQTETGGILLTPLPGAWPLKPGSATKPFFGVEPALLDPTTGKEIPEDGTEQSGVLCFKTSWPSCMRTIYGDQQRYEDTYFGPYKGYYFTSDGSRRDEDSYYWITGRVDDVINVSGHRIGTAEVESALVEHPMCAEAAVVGYEHPIKGQAIYAYVNMNDGVEFSDDLKKELVTNVRSIVGAFASPGVIHWAPQGLPKTRSGKIMRRILRKIASNEEDQIGDTSTLADPSVVDNLLDMRGK